MIKDSQPFIQNNLFDRNRGIGLYIKDKSAGIWPKIKRALGYFMIGFAPKLMKFLAIAGTIAMWLVGGSLITHGVPSLHHFIESAVSFAASITLIGGVLSAITPLLIDLIVGFLLGAILVFSHLAFTRVARPDQK